MLLSLLVIIAGYVLLAVIRRGPLATAGLVASALAVPFFLGFATFSGLEFPPFSIDAVLAVSTLAWLVAFFLGPSRGHPFLLGLGLLGAWFFLLEQVTGVLSAPFDIFGAFLFLDPSGLAPTDSFRGFDAPDPTEIAIVSGLVAVLYLVVSRRLERSGYDGAATPFVVIGHLAALTAIFAVVDDLEEVGTGIAAMVVGSLLMWRGAVAGRRATTWLGGAYLALGGQSFVSGLVDTPKVGGGLLIVLGVVIVLLSHLVVESLHEPSDTEVGPSFADGLRAARATAVERSAIIGPSDPAPPPTGPPASTAPAPGWWQASDGNWYAPEQEPGSGGTQAE